MWFRRDLRVRDNEALSAAARSGDEVRFVALASGPCPGAEASNEWRRLSLIALGSELAARNATLDVVDGPPAASILTFARTSGARVVHCTRDWAPDGMAEEAAVRSALEAAGIRLEVSEGQLVVPPDALRTAGGQPYRIFTPFFQRWRSMLALIEPLPAPARLRNPGPPRAARNRTGAVARPSAPIDVQATWEPGEAAAHRRLAEFASGPVVAYERTRDLLGVRGTSELSPRLAAGELSPRQVLYALRGHPEPVVLPFIRQLAWREFAYHVLHHFPQMTHAPLRPEFGDFPWSEDAQLASAWQNGKTGYDLVDAAMRQLERTGWVHNRARLVAGSFLTKDLLVGWWVGERHYRRLLVDFDPAVNVFNWQWVAGCGADAAPFFRIFNPQVQQRRYDPDGTYVHRWLPERIGPTPRVVEHSEARQRALAAYAALRGRRWTGGATRPA